MSQGRVGRERGNCERPAWNLMALPPPAEAVGSVSESPTRALTMYQRFTRFIQSKKSKEERRLEFMYSKGYVAS